MAVHPGRVIPLCWSLGGRGWGEASDPADLLSTHSLIAAGASAAPCRSARARHPSGTQGLLHKLFPVSRHQCQGWSGMFNSPAQLPPCPADADGVPRPRVTLKSCKSSETPMHGVCPPSLQGGVGTHGCCHHCVQRTCGDSQQVLGAPVPWV